METTWRNRTYNIQWNSQAVLKSTDWACVSSHNHFVYRKFQGRTFFFIFCAVLNWSKKLHCLNCSGLFDIHLKVYNLGRLGEHCLMKAMCEQLLLWTPVDNLTLHYSGRQLRMNFIFTVAQWDKFFVFLLCYSVFLVWKLLSLGWGYLLTIQRKGHLTCDTVTLIYSCWKFQPVVEYYQF